MNDAVGLLDEIRHLMQLKGENPFKIRAFEKAAHTLSGRTDLMERAKAGTLTEIDGIGKGISEVLTEYFLKGRSTTRDELAASLPAGLLELTQIQGLGPKKAQVLIKELGVTSIGELEYACKENRLLKLKGFGPKLQQSILERIQFRKSNQGMQKLGDAFPIVEELLKGLTSLNEGRRVSETGELRRRMEVLSQLDFLVELPRGAHHAKMESWAKNFQKRHTTLPIRLHFTAPTRFGYELARTTGSAEHWRALGEPDPFDVSTEAEFFSKLGLGEIPPEARETGEEVALAKSGGIREIFPLDGVRGIFHNHTVRSDGAATLEEMVSAAKELGYEYIGISDHSQTAFYAQGLKKDALLEQEREIRLVREKFPEIKVFWGIESDILADGSLDYEPAVLRKFDFVVASIHSRFKMDRETMTRRVLEAVRNPFTRFVGHLTGRLLLGRPGYEIDVEKIIEEASRCDVAIELNANPARLDVDWRWGPVLRRRRAWVSINPDAHDVDGLKDTHYGVAMARKAILPRRQVLNSLSASEVERWLKRE